MRVVLDTNIFVSMIFGGQVGEINTAWRAGKFTLIISDSILSEYLDVLQRPKLRLSAATVSGVIGLVQRKAETVYPAVSVQAIQEDPSDNKFIEAALEGKAIYIVSGDKHLLKLSFFNEIQILSARDFIDRLG